MDASAGHLRFAGDAQAPVDRPGGHDHRVRGELLPGRQAGHQVFAVGLDSGDRYRWQEFHPIAAGLGNEPVGQLGAGDPLGEPRVIVDPVADPRLAAEGAGVNDDGVDAFPGGVDGSSQPGLPAADNDQIVGGPIRLEGQAETGGQGFVARVHLMGTVRVDHRGNDLPASLQLFKPLDRLRIGVNVDAGIADPVSGQELLHPFAVRAPGGPDNSEGRAMRTGHHVSHPPSVTPPPRPGPLALDAVAKALEQAPELAMRGWPPYRQADHRLLTDAGGSVQNGQAAARHTQADRNRQGQRARWERAEECIEGRVGGGTCRGARRPARRGPGHWGGVLRKIKQCLGVLALTALVAASVSVGSASAATQRTVKTKAQWQAAIAQVPAPGTGCYHASYPALQWHAVKCVAAPKLPLAPALPADQPCARQQRR